MSITSSNGDDVKRANKSPTVTLEFLSDQVREVRFGRGNSMIGIGEIESNERFRREGTCRPRKLWGKLTAPTILRTKLRLGIPSNFRSWRSGAGGHNRRMIVSICASSPRIYKDFILSNHGMQLVKRSSGSNVQVSNETRVGLNKTSMGNAPDRVRWVRTWSVSRNTTSVQSDGEDERAERHR